MVATVNPQLNLAKRWRNPLSFAKDCWPDVPFYAKEREIIQSVIDNDETFVHAGNMLGKDFVSGFLALWYFLTHHPVRVITTSVKEDHLRVLWGEIDRFIRTSRIPLLREHGGPLVYNYHETKKVVEGRVHKDSYLLGCVSAKGEGLSGHHSKYTLLIVDEASGVEDEVYKAGQGWMKKLLVIGNPNPCNNFFYKAVKAGDQRADDGHYYRMVIRIRAEDSPNVQRGLECVKRGIEPDNKVIVSGVLTYSEYVKRRKTWDAVRQCVGLDGLFYEEAGTLMFPPAWLDRSHEAAKALQGVKRRAKAIGIDAAEGSDKTAISVIDEYGLIELKAKQTPNTAEITGEVLGLMNFYKVPPDKVCFDRGGGGKQHADRLRQQGYDVRTVSFGEAVHTEERRRGFVVDDTWRDEKEERYVYKNRRAQMYGRLMELLNPDLNEQVFALPEEYVELRQQLAPIPLKYDGEGRLYLLPKNRRSDNSNEKTLTDLIGHSPDEADSLVCAIYAMENEPEEFIIRSMF